MGNSSSGLNKTFVTNQSRSNDKSKRPHSVLGISDDNNRNNLKSAILRSNNHNNKYIRPPGMQLPPLPRSHSFHQVLRPTENGQILAAKGTIRGLEFNKPLTKSTKIGEELNAILNSRRCKSEADLITDNSSSNDSNQSESSNYDENNKRKDNNNLRKSSASNGVAAKIHRAKYKAPQPPQLITNNELPNHHNYENNINSNDSHKKSAKKFGNTFINDNNNGDCVQKNQLIRKLSEKSFNKLSNDDSSRLLIIPRLRLLSQQHKDPGSGSNTNDNTNNHVIPSRYQSRNLIFDSKDIEGSNHVLRSDSKQDFRKLRRSSSNCDSEFHNKSKAENALNDKQFKNKPMDKQLLNRENSRESRKLYDNPFFKQLNSLSSEDLFPDLQNNNNLKYFDKTDFYKSDEYFSDRRNKSNNKSDGPALPPAFDDNFILRRSTPTAGLNEQKVNFFYNKQNQQNDKSNKNKPNNDNKRAILSWSENRFNIHPSPPPPPPPLPTDEIIRSSKSYNLRQLNTSSTPPPPPIHTYDYEYDISSANHYKSIRTNVSDSANYSDEDEEEEEIKVILRPQLPPLKREQLSETRRERILLSEDLFNLKPFNHRNHCWTPLHDLSTSEDDDDGINSGNHSDDSIQKCQKQLGINNSYDTRFTLKNQLKTLLHNNKLKQQNMFPY